MDSIGNAEYRKFRQRRGHARQMRSTAGAGDDDLEAGRLGALGEGEQPVRGAMGRDDVFFAGDAERGQRFGGMAHGVPVRLASHDDGDGRGHAVNSFRESKNIGRIIGSAQGSARRGKGSGMDYPVLVNPGKPPLEGMPMKKKTRSTASGACKTPQKQRRASARRPRRAPGRARPSRRRRQGCRSRRDAQSTDRRLRAQLAQALKRDRGVAGARPIPISCWVFPTGAASSANSIARSPISSAITPAAR